MSEKITRRPARAEALDNIAKAFKRRKRRRWRKMKALPGRHGGCLHCGYQHDVLPIGRYRICVGFGIAALVVNGKLAWMESGHEYNECLSVRQAENLAARHPHNDWQIVLDAPLSGRTYQRQGRGHWVLVKSNTGFA